MRTDPATQPMILRDLGDGLRLRRSIAADAEPLAAFMADAFRNPATNEPDEEAARWTRDLLRGTHPTFSVNDFTIVEDTRARKIVSALSLIPQTWSYAGIPIKVGRPEIVATHVEYRRRGLVRAQFEEIHRWSRERGDLMLAITGIPWYYRQFGYEPAIELEGGRTGYLSQIPQLADGATEPYRVRPALDADLPLLAETIMQGHARYLMTALRDLALWRYELDGRDERHMIRRELRVIETSAGEPVGALAHAHELWGQALVVKAYELRPGVSWAAVTPSVVRYLAATGAAYAARRQGAPFSEYSFGLGSTHPVYDAFAERLPHRYRCYAWYVRTPDIAAFLRQIQPALEQRLAASVVAGHSGELKLNFFRSGVRLVFQQGRISAIEPWQPQRGQSNVWAFPDLTFLQLLFGYRSLDELDHAFIECYGDSAALVRALFPKQPSYVWGIG
jgi:hypothetical protein